MKNAMQLKALIKNFALDKEIMPQAVLQNYMLERFLERISWSQWDVRADLQKFSGEIDTSHFR